MITKFKEFNSDFKFKQEFKYATVYHNSTLNIETSEPEEEGSSINSGTKIGCLYGNNAGIDILVLITNNTKFYSPGGQLTDDSYLSIKLDDDKFIDFHEPIDLMESGDWEQYIEDDPDFMTEIVKKYDLDHFILEL